jgi:hypothetical protein
MDGIQHYTKFIVAAIAAVVIVLNNGDVAGSVPLIEDISDNLAAVLGALGVLAFRNK